MFNVSNDYGLGFDYQARIDELVQHAEAERLARQAAQAHRAERAERAAAVRHPRHARRAGAYSLA